MRKLHNCRKCDQEIDISHVSSDRVNIVVCPVCQDKNKLLPKTIPVIVVKKKHSTVPIINLTINEKQHSIEILEVLPKKKSFIRKIIDFLRIK